MSSQYQYPPGYPYAGQPQQYDPSQYNQPQAQQAPLAGQLPAEGSGKGLADMPDPADQEFWDKSFVAAAGGLAGEVRLTSDVIVDKAAACAEKMVEFRKAYIKGETPGQIAKKQEAEDKKKADAAVKKQQDELKAAQQSPEAQARQEQLKKNQEAQLAPPPPGLSTTLPPQSGPVSDWIAAQPQPQPQQPPAA